MASFLQRVFSGVTGDFKGAFRTNDTVKIEKDPNDPTQDILRFGKGEGFSLPDYMLERRTARSAAQR